jgi:membrane protease YdiL (CAAX protease family)/ABC-type multidrug transport system permease subunit
MWIIARIAMRRWVNRVTGQRVLKWGRKKTAPEVKRAGTGRKGGTSLVLGLFIGAVCMFNGINLAMAFVDKLCTGVERYAGFNGPIALENAAYKAIRIAHNELKRIPKDSKYDAQRQEWLKNIREWFEYDKERKDDEKRLQSSKRRNVESSEVMAEPSPAPDEMMKIYEMRGLDAFKFRHLPTEEYSLFRKERWPAPINQQVFFNAVGLMLLLMALCIFLMSLGSANQDLGRMDWSMEWLFAFPVQARGLFAAQWVEFALVNALNWFIVFPFLVVLMWCAGWGWTGVPLAVLASLYFGSILGALRLLAETWLRKNIAPGRLKNLQAVITLAGTICFFALIGGIVLPSVPKVLLSAAANLPGAALWNPFSLPVLLLGEGMPRAGVVMILYASGFGVLAIHGAEWLVRDGLLTSTGTYRGSRGASLSEAGRGGWFSGIIAKELLLLSRDKNFLAQTLLVPLLIMGFNILLHPEMLRATLGNFTHASTLAFGLGVYVLMFGACHVLAVEGNGLWMLYTFPRDLHSMFVRKTFLWCGFASLYTLVTLVVAAIYNPALSLMAVSDAVMACIGVVIYSFIAAGIGVLATDPLEQEMRRKLRPDMMYLYTLLASFYAFAIYSPSFWAKAGQITLSTMLAIALWQKVRDRMPFMLDPAQEPPPTISLADGLIAVLAFFVLQGLAAMALIGVDLPAGVKLLIAFVSAGLLVSAMTLYIFWRNKVPNLLSAAGFRAQGDARASWLKSIGIGARCGAAAAGFAQLYLFALEWFEPLRVLKQEYLRSSMRMDASMLVWIAVLAVLAAPVFEEYIFRGLVYRGFRRSSSPLLAALASAGIFAVVHPPLAVVPVFGLGLATAWSFERCRLLIAPICAHMVYNSIVFGLQLLAQR